LARIEDLTVFLDKLVLALAKHWLLLINLVIAVYNGLPFLAPIHIFSECCRSFSL